MEKKETMADFAAELEESYKTLEEYEQYDIPEEDMTAWETLKEMMEQGTVVSVKVTESVPAGAVAFVEEVRGFIPASKLALHYVEDTSEYVGRTLRVRVISVDPETQKLILSTSGGTGDRETAQGIHDCTGNHCGRHSGKPAALWRIRQYRGRVDRTGTHFPDLRETD